MGFVADDDRVGVGDAVRVADEPLVGLDRYRAVGMIGAVEQRRAQALLVAARGDLADELIDEVAAVGQDQDSARSRGVDEADGSNRLAGAGRVLEPKAAVGARILGRLDDDFFLVGVGLLDPVDRLLLVLEDLVRLGWLALLLFYVLLGLELRLFELILVGLILVVIGRRLV